MLMIKRVDLSGLWPVHAYVAAATLDARRRQLLVGRHARRRLLSSLPPCSHACANFPCFTPFCLARSAMTEWAHSEPLRQRIERSLSVATPMMKANVMLSVFRHEVDAHRRSVPARDLELRTSCLAVVDRRVAAEPEQIAAQAEAMAKWKEQLEAEREQLTAASLTTDPDAPPGSEEAIKKATEYAAILEEAEMDLSTLATHERELEALRRETSHMAARAEVERGALKLVEAEGLTTPATAPAATVVEAAATVAVSAGQVDEHVERELRHELSEEAHVLDETRQRLANERQRLRSRRALLHDKIQAFEQEGEADVLEGGSVPPAAKTGADAISSAPPSDASSVRTFRLATLRADACHVTACLDALESRFALLSEEEALVVARLGLHDESRALDARLSELSLDMGRHIEGLQASLADDPSPEEQLLIEDFFTNRLRGCTARGQRRYAEGMELVVLHSGRWVEADVVAPPKEAWKIEHDLKVVGGVTGGAGAKGASFAGEVIIDGEASPTRTSLVSGASLRLALHPFNHAPRLLTIESFNSARGRHERAMRAQHATVADALSGKRLDVQKQMVPIRMAIPTGEHEASVLGAFAHRPSTEAPAVVVRARSPQIGLKRAPTLSRMATRSLSRQATLSSFKTRQESSFTAGARSFAARRGTASELRRVDGVKALSSWFEDSYQRRVKHPDVAGGSCVFITANPAAGKTCLMSQLVVESLESSSSLVPIFIKVQELQKKLREEEHKAAFANMWNWVDAYLAVTHGADSELYLFLRQALMARRALVLLDGIDEAGQARVAIERHISEVLVPQGHCLVMTSRPAGVDERAFDRSLVHRLELQPLSDEQQAKVIEHRLGAGGGGGGGEGGVEGAAGKGGANKERAAKLLEYVRERVPRDAETNERVTSNPLMLSMVISIYEINEANGKGGMPTTVWELYEFASSTMLQRLDKRGHADEQRPTGASAMGGNDLPRMVEAIFFQAHAAQARVILNEHINAAALGLHSPAELAALQGSLPSDGASSGLAIDESKRLEMSFKDPRLVRHKVEQACERLPEDVKRLVQLVRDRVVQDRLPLLSLLQPEPLQMQSSHLSFQEFYAARAIRSGDVLLPKAAAVPWRWPAWWSNTLRLGGEMGESFAHGLLKAIGVSASRLEHDGLDVRARIAGDRPTSLLAVGILLKVTSAVDLRDNRLEDADVMQRLAMVIAGSIGFGAFDLHSLNVAGNAFGAAGAEALCAVLPASISDLDLSRTMLCVGESAAAGIDALFSSPCAGGSLCNLKMQRNQLTDEDGKRVFKALAAGKAKSLELLSLAGNQLGAQSARGLQAALQSCPRLATLNLSDNDLCSDGAAAVAKAVPTSKTLTDLDLSANRLCSARDNGDFSIKAVDALAEMLSSSTCSLSSLSLSRNRLCCAEKLFLNGKWRVVGAYTDAAPRALSASLLRRKTESNGAAPPLTLQLADNLMHAEDLKRIASALTSGVEEESAVAISQEQAITAELQPPEAKDANAQAVEKAITPDAAQAAIAANESGTLSSPSPSTSPAGLRADTSLDEEARAREEAVSKAAEEAKARAESEATAKAAAAAAAKAQREAEERFAAESRAKKEADDQARATAKAEELEKSKQRKLVGPAKDEAIARVTAAILPPAATAEDDVMQAFSDLVVRAGAKSDAEKVGLLPSGTTIRVVETRELEGGTRKALIQHLDAVAALGWVSMTVGGEKEGKEGKDGKVKSGGRPALVSPPVTLKPSDSSKKEVIVREKAGAKAAEKSKLPKGSNVHVLDLEAADGCIWARIALEGTDLAEAGWIRHTAADGKLQVAAAVSHKELSVGKAAAETTPPAEKQPTLQPKTGKGAATRKSAVKAPEPKPEEPSAKSTAPSVLSMVKHKRLASVKNNMVRTCHLFLARSHVSPIAFSASISTSPLTPPFPNLCRTHARCASGMMGRLATRMRLKAYQLSSSTATRPSLRSPKALSMTSRQRRATT